MKRFFLTAMLVTATALWAGTSNAGKPIKNNDGVLEYLGNGFPSGPHFNLILHGKKDDFACPAPQFFERITTDIDGSHTVGDLVKSCPELDACEATTIEFFGNVVNFQRDTTNNDAPVSILIQSGRGGPKKNPGATELQVTDWCAEAFPDFPGTGDGDPAEVLLPKDSEGYAVFLRVLGKPADGGGPDIDFFVDEGGIQLVEDEFGNDLVLLGLLTSEGTFDSAGLPANRFDTTKPGKGAKKATDISDLFNFDGRICFINDADIDLFCIKEVAGVDGNEDGICDGGETCENICADFTSGDTNNDGTDDITPIDRVVCCAGATNDGGTVVAVDDCPDDDTPTATGYAFCQKSEINDDDTAFVCPALVEGVSFSVEVEDLTAEDDDNDGDGICETAETCKTITVGDTLSGADAELCEKLPECRDFTNDPVFIFHLSEFVNLLLGVDTDKLFNAQVRFYPLPLQDNPDHDETL